ncbi:SIR2 family protein [Sphingopyxis terrae]|uniref:SIR2 family protein n=1 Tax=Sphingopyxis terrae TaxID=33052 RepID=UPI002A0ACC39|nr:SIR2 family protein [Sphingopyxis terrae]MDX8356131.1 SIR2 family protein [Sphingopyxis terrae]
MPKVVIFAGAGASKAVSSDKFPTTIEFFDRLPDRIKSNDMFRLVESFFAEKKPNQQIDIEEILWELQSLKDFCSSYSKQDTMIGYSLARERILKLVIRRQGSANFGLLSESLSQTKSICENLISEINSVVYDLYSHEPLENDLKDNWIYLIDKLERNKTNYNIFTTNYDVAIETAVAIRGRPNLDNFSGTVGRISKKLDLDRWKSAEPVSPLLTKLHGSINWKFGQNAIQVGDLVYTGDHGKQAIIYPGFKGTSDSEFFAPLHEFLGARFEDADAIIFIGFAFRDQYINEMIGDRLSPGCSVYVINPQSVRFPVRRAQAKPIKSGFDRASIDQCFADLAKKKKLLLI